MKKQLRIQNQLSLVLALLFVVTVSVGGWASADEVDEALATPYDLLLPSGALWIGTSANEFSLNVRDPNGDLGIAVPTFRAASSNTVTALDVIPNGSSTDSGWGNAWADICNSDITNDGSDANTSCVHLGARSGGEVDIGENSYGDASVGPVVIVDGGAGGRANKVAAFSDTSGIGFLTIYSAAGNALAAAAAGNAHYKACVSDATLTGGLCVQGTAYSVSAGAGSGSCEVVSSGSAWTESGPSC